MATRVVVNSKHYGISITYQYIFLTVKHVQQIKHQTTQVQQTKEHEINGILKRI